MNTTDLNKMKRAELDELALEHDIDPKAYSRAGDLRDVLATRVLGEDDKSDYDTEKVTEETAEKAEEVAEEEVEKKGPRPNPPRPRHERRSKRYQEAYAKIDTATSYSLEDAVKLAKDTATTKFDAAVELHLNLGVDPKQADQLVRGTVVLPHGSGKTARVAALVTDEEVDAAKKAGADVVGNDALLEQIKKEQFDFDILIAHPDVMKDLAKHAKTLGPKGLMPSPKAGTVSSDIPKTVSELKAGRIEFRVDRYGIIHQMIGRASFTEAQLKENIENFMAEIKSQKPSSLKGSYLRKATLTTSMGPGITVSTSSLV